MGLKEIEVDNIENYSENPRHKIGQNESDTLKKLFDAAGHQNMINLAKDIYTNGLVNASLITVVQKGTTNKYTVYEGNRRIACIKLILHPEHYSFLTRKQINCIKKLKKDASPKIDLTKVQCLVTNKEEAFFIMERLHSGEDKGKGPKAWSPREQEAFVTRTRSKDSISIAQIISDKYEEFFGENIEETMAYTNIQRLFNNLEIRGAIGIEKSNIDSFTIERMKLIRDVIDKVNYMAKTENFSISRKFNKRKTIEAILIPIIENLKTSPSEEDAKNSSRYIQPNISSNNRAARKENKDASSALPPVVETSKSKLRNKATASSMPKLSPEIGKGGKLLVDEVPFTNKYQSNIRINTLVHEVNFLQYKKFRLSTQYLLRALMEVYGHEYVDYFIELDKGDPKKMKGIAKARPKRKQTLQELYRDHIGAHLKNNFPEYDEQVKLIETALSKSNDQSSLTKTLNFMVHSQKNIPDITELVEAWIKIKCIVEAIDNILYEAEKNK